MPKTIEPKMLDAEELQQQIINLLEGDYRLNNLDTMCRYTRNHDDDRGTRTSKVNVIICDDDSVHLWITTPEDNGSLRFRAGKDGGTSRRVHNAIVLLALAIKMDNEKKF